MTKKKHSEIIKKWADGAAVQWYNPLEKEWQDVRCPMFHDEETYRIKSGIIRVALHSNSDNQVVPVMWDESSNFDDIEKYDSFIKWLTDEVIYEV